MWFVSLTARMLPCHGSGAGSIPAQTAIYFTVVCREELFSDWVVTEEKQ